MLEKMHAKTLFEIFRSKPELDIVAKSPNPARTKEMMIKAILATDMGSHKHHLDILKEKRKKKTLSIEQDKHVSIRLS